MDEYDIEHFLFLSHSHITVSECGSKSFLLICEQTRDLPLRSREQQTHLSAVLSSIDWRWIVPNYCDPAHLEYLKISIAHRWNFLYRLFLGFSERFHRMDYFQAYVENIGTTQVSEIAMKRVWLSTFGCRAQLDKSNLRYFLCMLQILIDCTKVLNSYNIGFLSSVCIQN